MLVIRPGQQRHAALDLEHAMAFVQEQYAAELEGFNSEDYSIKFILNRLRTIHDHRSKSAASAAVESEASEPARGDNIDVPSEKGRIRRSAAIEPDEETSVIGTDNRPIQPLNDVSNELFVRNETIIQASSTVDDALESIRHAEFNEQFEGSLPRVIDDPERSQRSGRSGHPERRASKERHVDVLDSQQLHDSTVALPLQSGTSDLAIAQPELHGRHSERNYYHYDENVYAKNVLKIAHGLHYGSIAYWVCLLFRSGL